NRLLILKNHLTPKLSLNSISHYHQFGKLSTNCFDSLEKDLQICNLSSTSSHKPPEKIKESRSNFKHFSSLETRWRDNDIYGHVNNVTYYSYFDTAPNALLIQKTGFDIPSEKVPFIFRSLDKLKKIGEDGVLKELTREFTNEESREILKNIIQVNPTDRLKEVFYNLEKLGIDKSKFEFSPTLARGLNYYTGMIFEIEIDGYTAGSVCGGGRYNNLIGMFTGRDISAVGFAFGFDRLIDAMAELKLFPDDLSITKALVTIFSPQFKEKSIEISSQLQSNNISTELYLDEKAPLDKQLKYANQKQIPYVLIIGQEEAEKNVVTLRNMNTREQKTTSLEEIIAELR
ncbi:MAG: His/Gly/Thr/Pro-type tRNA ligase C-terminal domain-containing protein, partial [Actinobacteria bacterium]|nr:His/Gly/Thr/Pro-type tRNA ligase C-terminal domain-containing protein [Actinomycetota bacterium]